MKHPPYLIRVHINNHNHNINLWLPLFIILPIIFIFLLILIPIILVAAAVLWYSGWGRPLLMTVPAALGCLCALHGLEVDFKHNEARVYISIK